jgi:hypothetical protein
MCVCYVTDDTAITTMLLVLTLLTATVAAGALVAGTAELVAYLFFDGADAEIAGGAYVQA